MKRLIYSFFAVFALSFVSIAQKPSDKHIGKILDEYLTRMSAFGFGGAVIVEKENRVILRKGYGFANQKKRIPFTADTPFPVQSISKQFTGASILKLEEQGKLGVTDSIAKFLNGVPDDKKAITIQHLLTHTSGFTIDYSGYGIFNRNEAVKAILSRPLGNPVGKVMRYNNDGYDLLAAIVENVSGLSLPEFVRQNFFVPAGMETAGFQGDGDFWKKGEVAHGYNSYFDNGSPQFTKSDWDGYGSGDVVMSANDLFKWELSLRSHRVLSAKVKEKMFTPYSLFRENWNYGYGWFIVKSPRGTTEFYHGGGDIPQGYTASYTRYPTEKMTIIIFSNTMIDEMGFLRAVKIRITDIAFGKKVELPPGYQKVDASKIRRYAGLYQASSNEKFVVRCKNNQLMIGGIGQNAINFLTTPGKETRDNLERYTKLTSAFVKRIVRNTSGNSSLRSNFEALKKSHGTYKGFQALGTYPVSEVRKISTTYIELKFETGNEIVRFIRRGGNAPYMLSGSPFPALTPMMAKRENNFVAYYPMLRKSVHIQFKVGRNNRIIGLTLNNGDQYLSAKKLN